MKVHKLDYFYSDSELPPYLPYPRFLLDIPIGMTPRLVYAELLARSSASRFNGWVDDKGRVYVIYTLADLARDIDRCPTQVKRALAELEEFDLIHRVSSTTRAKRIYVRFPPDKNDP